MCLLDIRQLIKRLILKIIKDASASKYPFKTLKECFRFFFDHTKKIHDISINIIEYLDSGWWFAQKDPSRSTKHFYITLMRWK